MPNTPTDQQIKESKTWTELYIKIGMNPRNNRGADKIQHDVRSRGLANHLDCRQRYTIDDDTFRKIVSESLSIRDSLRKLGLNAVGGAYLVFHKRVAALGIDTSHFLGQGAAKGKQNFRRRNVQEYLKLDGPAIGSDKLKKKLFADGLKEKCCEQCSTTEWLGQPAPMQLDHVNGNNRDNRIENLKILCAMCHAMTPTYCGKNKKRKKELTMGLTISYK